MAADDTPQRAYRAACPGCGAPVEFRSAQSTHAVCGYCQSTLVRSGDTLSRIGKMAELFGDFSPLQLQVTGAYKGRAFTLVGRLQYRYGEGTWTEWYALLEDGSTAFLSEDNGAYVFVQPATLNREVPPAERFRVGATTAINGKAFSVASNETVSLIAAQGELPHLPALGASFAMVELRSADGEVLSIDYGPTLGGKPAVLSRGRSVLLDELKLAGLKQESATNEKGHRLFDCPNCGAPIEVTLATTQSITCGACHSLMDLSKGVGKELKAALQRDPINPLIPLGRIGELQGVRWQVVGFQHRMGHEPGEQDEQFGWEEYLLYNRKRGFIFLVDATDGWSLVKPLTGAPSYKAGASTVTHLGTTYRLVTSYEAETGYVVGEFYWQVRQGQRTFNRDFAKGKAVLSQETSAGKEIVWSGGSKLDAKLVAKAFKLEAEQALFKRGDAGPLSSASWASVRTILIVVVLLMPFLLAIRSCASCDPAVEECSSSSSSRSSGGSFGGYSGGGGHK